MDVRIGIGIDGILFGFTKSEMIEKLGEPDKIVKMEILDGTDYFYNDLQMHFSYYWEIGDYLESITTANPDISLWGKKIMGMSKYEIENLLHINKISKMEYEDYETFETIFCEEIWMEFHFEFDKLQSIYLSVCIDEDDNIMWPNKVEGNNIW